MDKVNEPGPVITPSIVINDPLLTIMFALPVKVIPLLALKTMLAPFELKIAPPLKIILSASTDPGVVPSPDSA